jgi:hypothetical protein
LRSDDKGASVRGAHRRPREQIRNPQARHG